MKELCIFKKGVKNGWTVDIFPLIVMIETKAILNPRTNPSNEFVQWITQIVMVKKKVKEAHNL